jgi:hypothetical protein
METFGWNHFATLGTLGISLIAVGVSLWTSRKADTRMQQAEACRFDHEGIRGILVSQGAALSESVKQQARAVESFSQLATSMALNHKDVVNHHLEVTRVLGDIARKLEK